MRKTNLKISCNPIDNQAELYILDIELRGEKTTIKVDKENLRVIIQELDNNIRP